MQARNTRAGGRHLARERGAEDHKTADAGELPIPACGTIADRLDVSSWMELATFLDTNVLDLTQRYQVRL